MGKEIAKYLLDLSGIERNIDKTLYLVYIFLIIY
jgi:hypothetical protein